MSNENLEKKVIQLVYLIYISFLNKSPLLHQSKLKFLTIKN